MSSDEESDGQNDNNGNPEGDNQRPRGSFVEMLNKQDSVRSFETRVHDIYNPGDSSIASENGGESPKRTTKQRPKNNILTEEVLAPSLQHDYLESELNNINDKSITLNFSQGRLDHSNFSRSEVDESGLLIIQNLMEERNVAVPSKKRLEAGSSEKEAPKRNIVQSTGPAKTNQPTPAGVGRESAASKGVEPKKEQLQQVKAASLKKATHSPKADSAKLPGPLRGDEEVVPKLFMETEGGRKEKAKQSSLPSQNTQKIETGHQHLGDKKAGLTIAIKTKHHPQQSSPDANCQLTQPTASRDTISSFHANPSSPSAGTKVTHSVTSSDTGNNFSGGENIQKLATGQPQRTSNGFDNLKNNLFSSKSLQGDRAQLTDRQQTLKKIYQEQPSHTKSSHLVTVKNIQTTKSKDSTQDPTTSPRLIPSKLTKVGGLASPSSKSVKSLGNFKVGKELSRPGETNARVLLQENRAISPSIELKESVVTASTTQSGKSRKSSQPSSDGIAVTLANLKAKQLATPKNEAEIHAEAKALKSHNAGNPHNFIIDQTKSPKNKQSFVTNSAEKANTLPSETQKPTSAKGTAALEKKSASAAQKKMDLKLNLNLKKINQAKPTPTNQKEYFGFHTDRAQKTDQDPVSQAQLSMSNQKSHEQNYFVNNSPRQNPQPKKSEPQRLKNGPKQLNANFGTKSSVDLELKATDFSSSSFKGGVNHPSERVKTDVSEEGQPAIKNFYQEITDKVKLLKQISGKKR